MLLSDGTVMGMNGSGQCVRLTPDIHGNYISGTWTTMTSMNYSRLFCSSQVLTNGKVYVAGGEYGGGPAEVLDPQQNVWNVILPASGSYSDAASMVLPNGNVLQSDSQSSYVIYNAGLNTFQAGGPCADMNETSWVKLPNDNVLGLTGYSVTCAHYVPSLNAWYSDNSSPVTLFGYGAELGAALVLPNGNVFQIGGTTNTAIYTPGSTLTSAGSWVAGPPMVFGTNLLGAVDAPAAMMVNGNILLDLGPIGGFNGPCYFYEYNYLSNSFTQVTAPGGGSTYNSVPYANSMLCLPDGNVLFVGGQNSRSLYVYTPTAAPLAMGQPTVSNITENVDGSYHLTGVGLAGISAGASYGDDEQMDSNYPLVRLTNSVSGNVYYARSYGWTSTTIQSTNLSATEFTLPQGLPAGNYSLALVANGFASLPQAFTYAPPPVPTGLTANSGSNTLVTLSWNASSGATGYNLKRSATSTGFYATIATLSGTTFTNSGLTNGVTYFYKVAAIGAGGPSSDSTAVSAVPSGPPPVPTGLTAVTGANAQVPLTWFPSYGATNYNLKRATVSGGPYTAVFGVAGTNYTDTAVTNGTAYYYVLTAVGTNGESAASSQVTATPLTPVVVTWFKADAITGLGNGSAIVSWLDSSGSGFTASQTTAGQRPTYVLNAINSLPVVHFTSTSSQSMTFNRPVQDNFTIFCVFRSSQGVGSGTLFYQGAGLVNGEVGGTVNDYGTCLFANGAVCAGTGNPDVAANSLPGYNDGKPHLMTFRRNKLTGQTDLYMDGAWAGSVTGNTSSLASPTKLALGALQTGGNYLNGDLGEVKIYSSALSDKDRTVQESALIAKWGITNKLVQTGNLVVNVDATTAPVGALAYLTNNGTAGGVFQAYTNSGLGPQVVALGTGGTRGVLFDGNSALVHNT
ncbi:MAG TPA: LamG-like jellyroll fold domain-containing protein, partial [Verrucomicrobiae bacterium]